MSALSDLLSEIAKQKIAAAQALAARQGEPDAARTAYERGHEIIRRLVGLAPVHAAFKRDLAWFEARLAELKQ